MLSKQITKLLLNDPFFGSLLLNLQIVKDPGMKSDMSTDGIHIFYNPIYVKNAKPSNLRATLIHELLHCILLHMTRRGGRDHKGWNIACDYAVNYYIKHNTKYVLTDDFIYDAQYKDMSAEQIYDKLPQSEQETENKFSQVLASGGELKDAPPTESTDEPSSESEFIEVGLEEQWKANVIAAQNTAKSAGFGTSNIESVIDEILNPTLPWHVILMDLLQEQDKSDYSWSRPNIAFIAENIYLPSAHNHSASELVIALDTSCSVDEAELAIMQAELNGILETIRPSNMTIIQCDTRVNDVSEYTEHDLPVRINFKGRGGTAFKPVFDYVQKHIEDVKCLVYFTDLGGSFNFDEPDYPVFWVNTYDKQDSPMGTTVHVNT